MPMDSSKIEALLAKYWECETSLEEEQQLRDYFRQKEVPGHLASYKPLFHYYEKAGNTPILDAGFDKKVLGAINAKQQVASKGKVVSMFSNLAKIAAVILVVVAAGYFIKQEYTSKKDKVDELTNIDTFEDPQKAFEETKKALQVISANFNKGRKQASKVAVFHDAQEKAKNIEKEL